MIKTAEEPQKPQMRRQLIYVLLGLFLLGAAGWLVHDRLQVHTTIAPMPEPYKYNVLQSVSNKVQYRSSSFFNDTPGPSDTAYIADLTDNIDARFHYHFSGDKTTKLSYQYEAKATVQGTYGSAADSNGISNVWTKQYQLLKPVSDTRVAKSLDFDPLVRIPFAQYKQAMDQFRQAFNTPLNGEMVVTYTVHISGKVNGTPFDDTKVSTIKASLDQQVYRLAVQYTKQDSNEVFPAKSQKLEDVITKYEIPVAIALTIIGLAYIIYGFRKQIFKTPYMRELEKIYRYHDGIIIRARRPTNLSGKNVVPVESFNDLLNLEEEIKTPIVASPAGDSATQFMITRDDIVYVYTLGDYEPEEPVTNNTPPRKPPKVSG